MDTTNAEGAPSFAQFPKGGSWEYSGTGTTRVGAGCIGTRPYKMRLYFEDEKQGRATRRELPNLFPQPSTEINPSCVTNNLDRGYRKLTMESWAVASPTARQ
jgi:hypothetical protein